MTPGDLKSEVERIAQARVAVPTVKELAVKHQVTPRYVQQLLRAATKRLRQFVFSQCEKSESD